MMMRTNTLLFTLMLAVLLGGCPANPVVVTDMVAGTEVLDERHRVGQARHAGLDNAVFDRLHEGHGARRAGGKLGTLPPPPAVNRPRSEPA